MYSDTMLSPAKRTHRCSVSVYRALESRLPGASSSSRVAPSATSSNRARCSNTRTGSIVANGVPFTPFGPGPAAWGDATMSIMVAFWGRWMLSADVVSRGRCHRSWFRRRIKRGGLKEIKKDNLNVVNQATEEKKPRGRKRRMKERLDGVS